MFNNSRGQLYHPQSDKPLDQIKQWGLAQANPDIFFVYSVLKRLSTPFEKWPAFRRGIIDKNGNVLRKRETLTNTDDKKAWTYYDILVCNIKKNLSKVPYLKKDLAAWATALVLLKEEKETITEETSKGLFLKYYRRLLNEQKSTDKGPKWHSDMLAGFLKRNKIFFNRSRSNRSESNYFYLGGNKDRKNGIIIRVSDHDTPTFPTVSDEHIDARHWEDAAEKLRKFGYNLKEEVASAAPTNSASGGAVAGIGVGASGEPPVKPNQKRKILRRRKIV